MNKETNAVYVTPLPKINDARRIAAVRTQTRAIPVPRATINRLSRVNANLLAAYAARPRHTAVRLDRDAFSFCIRVS